MHDNRIILRARRRRTAIHILVLCSLCLVATTFAHAECKPCTDASRHSGGCPPWAVCSVHLGDCESGLAPADVCTGRCTAGGITRLVLEASAYAASDMPEGYGARLGVELVSPFARGHLAIHGQWWTDALWRFGPRLAWTVHPAVRVAASADIGYRTGDWGAGASAGVDYFPWSLSPDFIPLQFVSLSVEAGGLFFDSSSRARPLYLALGVRVWL